MNWTCPNKKCRCLKVNAGVLFMIRHVARNEYRVFYNGQRTAYSGDTWEQATKVVEHIVEGLK